MTGPWDAPGPHLRAFGTRKIGSRGYFFGVFLKSVILSKSCSRCGGSTIFKGRALQKSVRDPVRSGVRKKHGQKRTCRALRGRLGALPENRPPPGRPTRRSENFKKGSPRQHEAYCLAYLFRLCGVFFARGRSGSAPVPIFDVLGSMFDDFLASFVESCRGSPGSAGMLPGYAPDLRNSLSGVPPGVRRSRGTI